MASAEPSPSATVVLLRDGHAGVEVLMLKRSAELAFHGGAWVFPGGRVDPQDRARAGAGDLILAARHAAVREALEEAGVSLDPARLVPFAKWITPEGLPKRYLTWFFVSEVLESAVRVDGSEVVDHRWIAPGEALAARARGELELPAPTFVTLLELASQPTADMAVRSLGAHGITDYHPRMRQVDGGVCTLYQDDAAYAGGALDQPGRRHRLYMTAEAWRYER